MNRTILSLLLLSVVPSCSGADRDPNAQFSTREGFCQQWGIAACNETVVQNCQAPSKEACAESQKQFCMGLVPVGYSSKFARECVQAVQTAYLDAQLTLEELNTVRKLEAPCHQVVGGVGQGASCTSDSNCDMVSGLKCVQGVCAVPVVVGPGLACGQPGQVCEAGFYCNGSHCVVRKTSGSPCANDDECQEDTKCSVPDPGTGGAGGASGEPESGTCQPRAELSQECSAHGDCKSGFCNGTRCANNVVLSQFDPICDTLR